MPKKHDHQEGHQQLVTLPKAFISKMIKDKKLQDWALHQITEGGPNHKQVLSALLLDKSSQLVDAVSKLSGTGFEQHGIAVPGSKEDRETQLPVLLAIDDSDKNAGKIADAIAKAPAHESLAYLMAIQAIEWSLQNLKK